MTEPDRGIPPAAADSPRPASEPTEPPIAEIVPQLRPTGSGAPPTPTPASLASPPAAPTVTQSKVAPSTPSARTADGFRISIERTLAYASIAYGAGFCVVAIHTGRLGLPLLDLPQARYVVVGAPLALATFVGERAAAPLLRLLRRHAATAREGLARKAEVSVDVAQQFAAIASILPVFGISLFFVEKLAGRVLTELLEALDAGAKERAKALLDKQLRVMQVLAGVIGLVSLALYTALAGLVLVAYVVALYPKLPQTLGGGAPYRARLVLDTSKISPQLGKQVGFSFQWDKEGPPALTAPLEILYDTEGGLWLRRQPHQLFCIDKSAVLARLPQ